MNPELLFALAKMGHGDTIVVADANFPSDATGAISIFVLCEVAMILINLHE